MLREMGGNVAMRQLQACPLEPNVLERALARVGYYRHTAKGGQQVDYPRILDWFLKFTGTDLKRLTPAESHVLREQYRALQQVACDLQENDDGVLRHIATDQEAIKSKLVYLTENGNVSFGPFQLGINIMIPAFAPRSMQPFKYEVYSGEHVEPFGGQGLLHLLARSIQHSGNRLQRCQHCAILFVQSRPKQRYCARKCQQVASMRNLRARARGKGVVRRKKAVERTFKSRKGKDNELASSPARIYARP
jgi:hypothetical protein